MAFPPSFLDELRARLPVSEVVGRKVRLVKKGREFSGLCPFHNEKTPSFFVNDDKGFYHCFGCGAHGDVISFVTETQGLSFPEAVESLAGQAGLEVPQASPQERARERVRASLYDVVEHACSWFEGQLFQSSGREALAYLRGRGFTDQTIARFRLGYAPDGRGKLGQALEAQGITRDQLIEAGLVKRPEGGGEPRDYFFGRVIFPITDARGRAIAFGGRVLGDGQPKYLNSPETPLFHKGRNLYNLAGARDGAKAAGTIVVTEGYTDVIALAQAGLEHAVAPLGTALTEDQILALWRIVDEPVLCFDGDNAGTRAAWRAAERALPILKAGKSLRFVTLPAGEDPDSLVRGQGPAGMRGVLAGARSLVDVVWQFETAAGSLATPEQRADLERRLNAHVARIADSGVQFHYRDAFRGRMRELFAPRRQAFGGRRDGRFADKAPGGVPGLRSRGDLGALRTMQERALIALLVNHVDLIHETLEELTEVSLRNGALDTLLRQILNHAVDAPELDTASLCNHLTSLGFEGPLAAVLNPQVYRQASFAAPDAAPEAGRVALREMLTRFGRGRLAAERAAAEKDLADEMNEPNSNRLLTILRDQSGASGL